MVAERHITVCHLCTAAEKHDETQQWYREFSCLLALRWCNDVCERFSKSTADAFLFDAMPDVPETERILISVSFFSLVFITVCYNRCFVVCEWCRICNSGCLQLLEILEIS